MNGEDDLEDDDAESGDEVIDERIVTVTVEDSADVTATRTSRPPVGAVCCAGTTPSRSNLRRQVLVTRTPVVIVAWDRRLSKLCRTSPEISLLGWTGPGLTST